MGRPLEWIITPEPATGERCDSGACIAMAWTHSGNVLISADDDNARMMTSAQEMKNFILAVKAGHFDTFLAG